jgi:hypothetical protein
MSQKSTSSAAVTALINTVLKKQKNEKGVETMMNVLNTGVKDQIEKRYNLTGLLKHLPRANRLKVISEVIGGRVSPHMIRNVLNMTGVGGDLGQDLILLLTEADFIPMLHLFSSLYQNPHLDFKTIERLLVHSERQKKVLDELHTQYLLEDKQITGLDPDLLGKFVRELDITKKLGAGKVVSAFFMKWRNHGGKINFVDITTLIHDLAERKRGGGAGE